MTATHINQSVYVVDERRFCMSKTVIPLPVKHYLLTAMLSVSSNQT